MARRIGKVVLALIALEAVVEVLALLRLVPLGVVRLLSATVATSAGRPSVVHVLAPVSSRRLRLRP